MKPSWLTALLANVAGIATVGLCADDMRPFPITVHLSVDPSITSSVVRGCLA